MGRTNFPTTHKRDPGETLCCLCGRPGTSNFIPGLGSSHTGSSRLLPWKAREGLVLSHYPRSPGDWGGLTRGFGDVFTCVFSCEEISTAASRAEQVVREDLGQHINSDLKAAFQSHIMFFLSGLQRLFFLVLRMASIFALQPRKTPSVTGQPLVGGERKVGSPLWWASISFSICRKLSRSWSGMGDGVDLFACMLPLSCLHVLIGLQQ